MTTSTRSLRIAIVGPAHTLLAEPFAGGLEAHTHALASGLVARGHDVTVFGAPGSHSGAFRLRALAHIDMAHEANGRGDMCTSPVAVHAEMEAYLDAMVELSASSYDIVHLSTSHYLPFAFAPALPGAVTGTLHCPPYDELAHVLRSAAATAKPIALATVSDSNRRSWRHHADIDEVLTNGIDLDTWRPGPGGNGAVWVGRLVPEKAPHAAIEAAQRAGMPLTLIGPAHDRRYYARHIEPHLGGVVVHAGHLRMGAAAAAVGAASVAVVTPVWDEPFGLVIAEALACGTPVAAFGRGAVHDLVVDGTGVVTEHEDPAELGTAMIAAAGLDRRACRQHAEATFDLERMVDEYERWFHRRVASA